MNMDLELAAWRTDWLAPQVTDDAMLRLDLRRLVERKRRNMAFALIGQLLGGVALLAFSGWFASKRPTLEWILWAAVIWLGTFFGGAFTVWNNSGTWSALSQSNVAFLALSRQRCMREQRAIRLGRWFLAVQLAIVTGWLSLDFAMHRLPLRPYFFGGAITILLGTAYLEWFAFRERRIRRDLARLDRIESAGSD